MNAITIIIALICVFIGLLRRDAAPVDTSVIDANPHMKWMRLRDGRILEHSECGAPKQSAKRVLFISGFGTTSGCVTLNKQVCDVYAKHGLRITEPSLPGFGYSSSYPLSHPRKLADWPSDMEELMGTSSQYYVIGTSFGAMHAAIEAATHPDRVLGLALMSPTMPIGYEDMAGVEMATATKYTRLALNTPYLGDFVAFMLSLMTGEARTNAAPDIQRAIQKMRNTPGMEAVAKSQVELCERSTEHTYRGFTDNMRVLFSEWNIDWNVLATKLRRPVIISSAGDDTTNPPAMQRWVHKQIKGAEFIDIPRGWGHMNLAISTTHEQIIKRLLA